MKTKEFNERLFLELKIRDLKRKYQWGLISIRVYNLEKENYQKLLNKL